MIIAWAYMVELEDGLTKEQVNKLMDLIPEDVDVFPFHLNEQGVELRANSMAIGFIHNEYFDETPHVQRTLAAVCNDWDNEREDYTYLVEGQDEEDDPYQVIMLCDYETF